MYRGWQNEYYKQTQIQYANNVATQPKEWMTKKRYCKANKQSKHLCFMLMRIYDCEC